MNHGSRGPAAAAAGAFSGTAAVAGDPMSADSWFGFSEYVGVLESGVYVGGSRVEGSIGHAGELWSVGRVNRSKAALGAALAMVGGPSEVALPGPKREKPRNTLERWSGRRGLRL
eukprot:882393-Pelagomonas_calceolata.AAC.3